ncbi:NUDIX hydrolase [Zhihengliuella flava]|uniref:8-oxo-dGTP pyrophosphatase MutT (NUDIX family) n=1 Tax=Zhihengliuella flava TaxID=1285193 RepID=A0A931GFC5_9MICC|nr:8-oxo-dGTP pyrophosphatase MutT (NUDIX family) [Zhihengliuella flava]
MISLLTVAAVVIYDTDGRILLVRKRDTTKYMQPGGKLEPHESPRAAALRELEEELGLRFPPEALTDRGLWRGSAANEAETALAAYVFDAPLAAAHAGPAEDIVPHAELADCLWISPAEALQRSDLAPLLTEEILPRLLASPAHLS